MLKRAGDRGMTLIEILIALIVMVLGILGIMALFPPALQSSTESMEETNASILAESLAHAFMNSFQSMEEDKSGVRRVTLAHDLQAGKVLRGRYTFVLPTLPTDPTSPDPNWYHYPSTSEPPMSAMGDTGAKLPMTGVVLDDDDRLFSLGGDGWTADTIKSVHETNDPTDPLAQFGFSFDIRKIDDLQYQRAAGLPDPFRNKILTLKDYENMAKLYEIRIHTYRVSKQGGSGGTTGADFRRYITTFTKRIAVR